MDYTKIPRHLIYKEKSLDDFPINDVHSLDWLMLYRIETSEIAMIPNAEDYVCKIFNNAYYITTLVLKEKRPNLHVADYIGIADGMLLELDDLHSRHRYFLAMTMALVYNYLNAMNFKAIGKERLLKTIWDYFVHQFSDQDRDGQARFLFFRNVLNDAEVHKWRVWPERFEPRPIVEAVRQSHVDEIYSFKEYIGERILLLPRQEQEDAIKAVMDVATETGMDNDGKLSPKIYDIAKFFEDLASVPVSQLKNKGEAEQAKAKTEKEAEQAKGEAEQAKVNELSATEALEEKLQASEMQRQQLEAELAAYKERTQNRAGINSHLTALLGLRLAPLLNIEVHNKKQLAPVLSKLFGWGKRKLEQELCSYFRDEDELALADIMGAVSPELARKIYPKWKQTPAKTGSCQQKTGSCQQKSSRERAEDKQSAAEK